MGGCSDLNEADVAATGGRVSAAVADPAQSAADVAGNRSVDAGVLAITWSSTVTRRYNWSGLSQGLPNAQQIQIIHTAGPAGISLCEPPVPCTEKNCSDQRDLKRRNSEKKTSRCRSEQNIPAKEIKYKHHIVFTHLYQPK